ncbi:glycosyltransferase family 2 protein [Herbaspirillum sp. YR522]|uniref:glycosyltransferase family 2 protein n=1 Tax=Herbaspirillum sp. YR522 TaxID=1144342 RepID=UPI00026F767D|nr:glycosyltransferase [Herbaspirillum sp. YR522]EJN08086.1 putative glycosyltransferase [Herbaspirillum sp. YR522]
MTSAQDRQPDSSLAIGLCTYKRRPSLERLLEHIAVAVATLGQPATVIVVDNDGSDPEVRKSVEGFSARTGIAANYIIESTPGISAARNAIFDEATRLGVRFMAMIDDDEWPAPGWLVELLKTQSAERAAVVGGPVRPVFPDNAAHLQKYARYWSVQRQFLEGKPFVFCSCNFLIDMQAIANEPRPLFDEKFGLSGGGDTVFFRKLFYRGHPMAWSEDAWIHEEVPQSRAGFKWMRQRRYRVGNHAVRWESIGGKSLRSFAKTLGITARLPLYPLFRREPESVMVGWLLEYDKIRGRWASHFGDVFVEYARPEEPGQKQCR